MLLEDNIRDAILAVRWTGTNDGPHPDYFVRAEPDSFRLEASAASFLAHCIADHLIAGWDNHQQSSPTQELDGYGLEVIASYLEDQGYIVSSPD
jgi:hypothetical protein